MPQKKTEKSKLTNILRSLHNGDQITDGELVWAIKILKPTVDTLSFCGKRHQLSYLSLRYDLDNLENYQKARKSEKRA